MPAPAGPAADQHDHVALRNFAALDGLNGRRFGDKYPRRAGVPVDMILVHERRIDGRALDDRALRREIADGKTNGRSEPARPRAIGRHDHVVGIDAVLLLQICGAMPLRRSLPRHQSRHVPSVSPLTVRTLSSKSPAARSAASLQARRRQETPAPWQNCAGRWAAHPQGAAPGD